MHGLIKPPGGGVARRSTKTGGGLALINHTVSPLAEPLRIAKICCSDMQYSGLPSLNGGERSLDPARALLRRWLPYIAAAISAKRALEEIVFPEWAGIPPVTHADALKMLGVLFGTLSKSKDGGNATTLLTSCASMFDPVDSIIGANSGLWEPVSRHPAVLALAIKSLIATSVFSPSPSELRVAMQKVNQKLGVLACWIEKWTDHFNKADDITFEHARESWNVAYATATPDAVVAMLAILRHECGEDGDDEYPPIPPSDRYAALTELAKAAKARRDER